ncbi:GNAT family N-acetyltransferase [Gramella sp. MAR_2010_147]|uniref:GNAT family N-acetyltransferase n=1 Tax=Gramella sp. MAR_2010_147 TaxID=1250205 RepID=UPI00087DAD08|nr:GNAT family N-acetyltransferase [Gramella sp. MAR_2010_147]SDR96450.1 Acetyltransferase (GNAT) domain-containing protein [Gramella sp. MAR_2010_147]
MQIVSWEPKYSEEFKHMNIHWLKEFFWIEPHDENVLGNPEKYIIEPGGKIFFVKQREEIIGCVALMKIKNDIFELTKMAVKPEHRGKKIGHELMKHTILFAQQKEWKKLIIYSNRKLENAIHLYKKYGFEEIPIEDNNPYSRGDIKMQLNLS